ncbi:MAG: DNA-3-methyladenine glycosylase [Bacteroidales bacterium]
MKEKWLANDFFRQDVLIVAPALIGKKLVRSWPGGETRAYLITETEAYRGQEDRACHASRGKTPRTGIMYEPGGVLYMYLIYGMYWMLNVVTSVKDDPQAVLIRGLREVSGPGRLTRQLELDGSFNGEELVKSERLGIMDAGIQPSYTTHPRIGIDYAGEPWNTKPWRFLMNGDGTARVTAP